MEILERMGQALNLAPGVSFEGVADKTENYSGADLQAIINNAQLEAVHEVLSHETAKMKQQDSSGVAAEDESEPAAAPEVLVTMPMIEKATGTSRPSVSERDRRELQRVYERFVNKKAPEDRGTRQTMA
eukprot:COSAG05_NODE_1285_length_5279_cov_2.254633_4_plen_129_part_00